MQQETYPLPSSSPRLPIFRVVSMQEALDALARQQQQQQQQQGPRASDDGTHHLPTTGNDEKNGSSNSSGPSSGSGSSSTASSLLLGAAEQQMRALARAWDEAHAQRVVDARALQEAMLQAALERTQLEKEQAEFRALSQAQHARDGRVIQVLEQQVRAFASVTRQLEKNLSQQQQQQDAKSSTDAPVWISQLLQGMEQAMKEAGGTFSV